MTGYGAGLEVCGMPPGWKALQCHWVNKPSLAMYPGSLNLPALPLARSSEEGQALRGVLFPQPFIIYLLGAAVFFHVAGRQGSLTGWGLAFLFDSFSLLPLFIDSAVPQYLRNQMTLSFRKLPLPLVHV